MNKVMAEIIAGVIPRKMARNRWRGILRYGVINALKLKKEIQNNPSKPLHYLGVCVIAKNEGSYFREWIEWHLAQGVEKFYVYDNGSTDNTREVLEPYIKSGVVDYKFFPGHRRQLAAYDDCLKHHRYECRWIAFIDMDEFVVPIKDDKLTDYLKRLEDFPAVEINWLIFGSGDAKKRMPGGVMQRFHKHSQGNHPLNRHVKSIVDPRRVFCMIGCHEAARINGKAADSHGNPVKVSWKDRTPQHDEIRVNHYAVKSYQEFIEKQGRGRAAGREKEVKEEYFRRFDLNDLEDRLRYSPIANHEIQKEEQ